MAMFMQKPWYRTGGGGSTGIYGAEWAGGSSPVWTRTDDAVGFSDPNPYYSSMTDTPSSPFDNIMPWAGMRSVSNANAGTVVEIPKFYYKWTRSGTSMKLQISESSFEGSYVSPAHADRGDGAGERDYVYVGKYHCVSNYKSSSSAPLKNKGRSAFRSGIHNLGSTVWQWDYAMYWTIRMLYLVEYANWDFQATVGFGGYYSDSNQGSTYSMPYHTGTTAVNRTTLGAIQYRYIANLGVQIAEWIDGIVVQGNSAQVYCTNNPADFGSETTLGTYIGNVPPKSNNVASGWSNPWSRKGFEYAILQNASVMDSTYTTYVTDGYGSISSPYGSQAKAFQTCGCTTSIYRSYGLFYINCSYSDGSSNTGVGGRLMVLP